MTADTPDKITQANRKAWNERRFDAWEAVYGGVDAEAQRIVSNPEHPLRRILSELTRYNRNIKLNQ